MAQNSSHDREAQNGISTPEFEDKVCACSPSLDGYNYRHNGAERRLAEVRQ